MGRERIGQGHWVWELGRKRGQALEGKQKKMCLKRDVIYRGRPGWAGG